MTDPNAPIVDTRLAAAFAPRDPTYVVGRAYLAGDIAIYSGAQYRCTIPHAALEVLDTGKFELVAAALPLVEFPAGSHFYAIGA